MLISADYSQIELRVLAHMAGEEALIEAFRAGEDIHERTGQKLFGVNNAMDKHQLRSLSKMVNYAVLYGKTPFTLAKDINVTQEAAQEFITRTSPAFPRCARSSTHPRGGRGRPAWCGRCSAGGGWCRT